MSRPPSTHRERACLSGVAVSLDTNKLICRCTPANPGSSACYPIPESPLPSNMYGKYTEAPWANHTTQRPRYLSSAYIMGPVADMRALFRRANERAERVRDMPPEAAANSPASLEFGSDQAIFHHIFGEQEFQREIIRRRYGAKARRNTVVEGTVVDDVLNPSFPHEALSEREGLQDEFGIHIDYWSDLGMQTAHSDDDARWLMYNRAVRDQLDHPRHPWSCTPHASGKLPVEVLNSTSLPRAAVPDDSPFRPLRGWDEIALYTNLCVDTIPAIINHAGSPSERERDWPEVWLQPHGRRLIGEVLSRKETDSHGKVRGGAIDGPGGHYRTWPEICPVEVENELYRDYYDGEF